MDRNNIMRLMITYNLQLTTKKKAFTLMEILIAATIFAAVMVLTTGILGQSSSFRGKIRATREVSEETKKLADMITRNVRESNFPGKIELCIGTLATCTTFQEKTFVNGTAIIHGIGFTTLGNSLYGSFENESTPASSYNDGTTNRGQVLVTTTKDKYRVMFASTLKTVYYQEFPRVDSSGGLITLTAANLASVRGNNATGNVTTLANAIGNYSKLATKIYFSGYAPSDDAAAKKQQPYIQFFIRSSTDTRAVGAKNGEDLSFYNTSPPNSRAMMEIRSSVTVRGFAN